MHRKKLIKKIALPVSIAFIVSVIILLSQIPYRNSNYKTYQEEVKIYISEFNKVQQEYVKSVAKKIMTLPVEENLISELETEYLLTHQQIDDQKKYLWMTTVDGGYLFGTPKKIFKKLNSEYDNHLTMIETDDVYRDRNDFLEKLVDKYDKVDFSDFKNHEPREYYEREDWRFYETGRDYGYIRSRTSTFSSPVYNADNKLLGTLYLNVDDSINEEMYLTENGLSNNDLYDVLNVIFGLICGFSGVFLWFLLPTWVYSDALERDVKNPGIWAFLTLISLVFGLTIYLLTRPAETKSFHCPECEGELNGTRAFCPHCGNDLSSTFCQQCQYPVQPGWSFCPNCRSSTKQETHNVLEEPTINVIDNDTKNV